jgi:hypothetical protein
MGCKSVAKGEGHRANGEGLVGFDGGGQEWDRMEALQRVVANQEREQLDVRSFEGMEAPRPVEVRRPRMDWGSNAGEVRRPRMD